MEFLSEFGLAVVSAAILQNVVLTRGLGSCRRTLTLPVPRQILYLGGILTVVTVLAALIAWPLNRLVRTYQSQMQLTLRYITSITALVSICLVFLQKLLTVKQPNLCASVCPDLQPPVASAVFISVK